MLFDDIVYFMETGNQSQNIPAQQSVMKEFPKKEGKKQTIVISGNGRDCEWLAFILKQS